MSIFDYLQKTHAIDVLVQIYNDSGRTLSHYTKGGTDKTRTRRIVEARAKYGLVKYVYLGYYNANAVELTDKGETLVRNLLAIEEML